MVRPFTAKRYDKMSKKNAGRFATMTIAVYSTVMAIIIIFMLKLVDIYNDISDYRKGIDNQHIELEMTGRLSIKVYKALSSGSLYNATANASFRRDIGNIRSLADSITAFTNDENVKTHTEEIIRLLESKQKNRRKLENLFNNLDPIEKINQRLREIEDSSQFMTYDDSLIVSKIIRDTVFKNNEKKNFWQRLGEVFAPKRGADSIAYVSTIKVDTIVTQKKDSLKIVSEMLERSEEAKEKYSTDISSIIREINILLYNDRNISSSISTILVKMHENRLRQIDFNLSRSQDEIGNFFYYIFAATLVCIIAVITLVYLLIDNFIKLEKSNKSLKEEKSRVISLMKTRHTLLLNVSHDIKTPLSSITGYLSTWKDENRKEEIESMINSAGYINSLLENLLKFTALEQGKLGVDLYESNVNEVLQKIVRMFSSLADEKGLKMKLESRIAENTIIESDILKIEQIVINLVSNAVKYSTDGTVAISAGLEENRLEISVSDEGIGIPEEKLKDLFGLFSRLDDGKKISKGDGVGMFVVKGLVDLLGGKITVKSEKGKGSVFSVSVPVRYLRTEQNPSACGEKTGNVRIAIIDDDEAVLKVYSAIMAEIGITCDMYGGLEELEKAPDDKEYDIVLTDWEIGTRNAFDVLACIRARDAGKNRKTTVCGVTGRTDISKSDAERLGFDNIYYKPVTADKIREAIIGCHGKKKTDEGKTAFKTVFDMFADDNETLRNVLKTFISVSRENIGLLEKALSENDFDGAARLSHKMKPSFMQTGAEKELTDYLERMDSSRNSGEECFMEWKNETPAFIKKAGEYIKKLESEYLN